MSLPPARPTPRIVIGPGPQPFGGPARNGRKRRGGSSGRSPLVIVAALAALGLLAAVVVLVTRNDSQESTGPTAQKASTSVRLTAGTTTVNSPVANAQLADEVRARLMAAIESYVEAASVQPLRTGKAAPGALEALFDADAAARLTGPDRAVLADEGFPRIGGDILATGTPVTFTALVGADGKPVLVSTAIDVDVTARGTKGTVRVKRTGQLIFEPGADGWKITGWQLSVDRNGPGLPVTPTTAGATAGASSGSAPTTTTRKS